MPEAQKHEELSAFLPRKQDVDKPKRKMIALPPESYNRISTIAAELGATRTATIAALLDYYDAGEE